MTKTLISLPRKITETRKRVFLEELAKHGVVAEAARVATPHPTVTNGSSGFYRLRRLDPGFAEQWAAAQEKADAALLTAARERAIHGTEKGIFQRGARVVDHDGEPATERVYSDRLLELLLKSRFPDDFVERRQVEHRQNTATGWTISAADLRTLDPDQRDQLRGIVATIQAARGEVAAIEHQPAETIDADFEEAEELDIDLGEGELAKVEATP